MSLKRSADPFDLRLVVNTTPLDDQWVRVECTVEGCSNQGDIRIEYRGDINVQVDLAIEDAWCGEHLPAHLKRKAKVAG